MPLTKRYMLTLHNGKKLKVAVNSLGFFVMLNKKGSPNGHLVRPEQVKSYVLMEA